MVGKTESSLTQEPPADVAHKSTRVSLRSMVFVAAATTAALFILDSYWSEPLPPQPITFRSMRTGEIHASSGFGNLIATVCWLFAIGFTIRGCARLRKAMKYHYGTPEFARLWKRTRIYFILGIICLTFPFLQDAMQGHVLCRIDLPCVDIEHQQDNLQLLAVAFWYIDGLGFYFGSLALAKAQQLKDDPSAAALRDEAAACLLIGFMIPAAPLAWAGFLGVDLW